MYIIGLIKLTARAWLIRHKLIKRPHVDHGRKVAEFMMETALAMYFHRFVSAGGAGKMHGEFFVPKLPWITDYREYRQDDFHLVLDLEEKRFVSANLGGMKLSAADALIIVTAFSYSCAHATIHDMANWGVNPEGEHPFLRLMSEITVYYNYLGSESFPRLAVFFGNLGFYNWIHKSVRCGDKQVNGFACLVSTRPPVCQHAQVAMLSKYSEFVNFIIKVRRKFLSEFNMFHKDFVGCDAEACFVGSVMHSLDHTQMAHIISDGLMCTSDTGGFQYMQEISQSVRFTAVDDIPVLFPKSFKDSPHPFHQHIYEYAKNINERLARKMDCCIVK